MNSDDFENQLKRQPLRAAPAAWRAEIREAARAAASRTPVSDQEDAEPFVPWWRGWLWPSPQAWAGLATVWLVIFSIHAWPASRPTEMAHSPSAPPAGTNTSLLAQRRELARLLEGSADIDSIPKPAPGPRSEATAPSKV